MMSCELSGVGASCMVPTFPLLLALPRQEACSYLLSAEAAWGLGHRWGWGVEGLSTCTKLISNVTLQSFCYSNYQHHMDRNLMLPRGTFKMYL